MTMPRLYLLLANGNLVKSKNNNASLNCVFFLISSIQSFLVDSYCNRLICKTSKFSFSNSLIFFVEISYQS